MGLCDLDMGEYKNRDKILALFERRQRRDVNIKFEDANEILAAVLAIGSYLKSAASHFAYDSDDF